jgi:hypothetical protein
MTTQVHAKPGETLSEMSTTPEREDPVSTAASRLLLLALDDFDSLLTHAPALPDPDHAGWPTALYPWIEDLARARQHVEEALASLGVQRSAHPTSAHVASVRVR